MRHLPHVVTLAALAPLAACGSSGFYTDNGQLQISAPVVDLEGEDGGPNPVLVGTKLCPTINAVELEGTDTGHGDEYNALDCFAQAMEGPATPTGECFTVDAPGVLEWDFAAQECAGNAFGYTPVDDHVSIEIVGADEVEGHLPMRIELAAESWVEQGVLQLAHPDDWLVPDGATWRLVAGQPVDLQPGLRRTADGRTVAWALGELTSDGGATVERHEDSDTFRVVAKEGDTSTLTLSAGGSSIEVGAVEGVSVDEIASVEIAIAYWLYGEDGTSAPIGARAVTRDADGNLILGAPVEWRFTAREVQVGPDATTLPGNDYAMFGEECTDPSKTFGEQKARLTAKVGNEKASVDVVWTPRLEAQAQEDWVKPAECQKPTACGCASGRGAPALSLVALAALALRRRR